MSIRDFWREASPNALELIKLAREFVDQEAASLSAYLREINRQYIDCNKSADSDAAKRVTMTALVGHAVVGNIRAMRILLTDFDINNGYIIARALVERSINFCYLLYCEEVEFDNWIRYSNQKSFRLLNRYSELKHQATGAALFPDEPIVPGPNVKADLDQFTAKRGAEITRWTQRSLRDRVLATASTLDDFDLRATIFHMALAGIYDIASEAMHGTLVGAAFSIGSVIPQHETFEDHAFSLLLYSGYCMNAMIWAGSRKDEMESVHASAKQRFDALLSDMGQLLGDPANPSKENKSVDDSSIEPHEAPAPHDKEE